MRSAVQGEAERYYTVEEANASLERVRDSLARIRAARNALVRSARRIPRGTNGGGRDGVEQWTALRSLREELEGLASQGIILRDADRGLIDFPSRRDGRLVYLCWLPDQEDEVRYWHEANTGFTGRKPLAPP